MKKPKPTKKPKRKPAKTPVKLLPKSKRRRDICEYD